MGQDDLRVAIAEEGRRNPFLQKSKPVPVPGPLSRVIQDQDSVSHEDVAAVQTNIEALISQISMNRMSDCDIALACDLAHCLDERGFFTETPEEIGSYLEADPHQIVIVVDKLQSFVEPVGVFAWSLKDCFAIQLKEKNRYDPLIAQLLDHLSLIASQDIDKICETIGVDEEDAQDMLADIRNLNPAPLIPTIEAIEIQQVADLVFIPEITDKIRVELNEASLPEILTDDALFSRVKTTHTDNTTLSYYHDCYRTAGAFVLAIQKRANTLLNIGRIIANTQSNFIRSNRSIHRKPLTMRRLAAELGLNKSTVSRALNNCLIETPHGLKPAIDFFVRPLSGHSENKTREEALNRLSTILKTEDQNFPYSDQRLSELLSQTNCVISRRTIAKYRGLLGVPNAFARRCKKLL